MVQNGTCLGRSQLISWPLLFPRSRRTKPGEHKLAISRDELISLFLQDATPNGWVAEDALANFDEFGITGEFFPLSKDIFNSLKSIRPEEVRYLIVGKDPYPKEANGHPYATGIAFEVNTLCKVIPDSLRRLVRSIYIDDPLIEEINRWINNGDADQVNHAFTHWVAENSILMLNSAFTVPQITNNENTRDVAGSHIAKWHKFTSTIVAQVVRENPHAKLIAWGAEAREVICDAMELANVFSYHYHPSYNHKSKVQETGKDFSAFWTDTIVGRSLTIPRQP